jgi:hypothetical protein
VGQVFGLGIASMQFGTNHHIRSIPCNAQEHDVAAAAELELEFHVVAQAETGSGASNIGVTMLKTGFLALSVAAW